jgi:hypothetical protein
MVAALPAKPTTAVAGPTPAAAETPSLMVVTANGADVVQQTLNYVADGKANVEQLGRVVTPDRLNRIDNQLVIQADSVDEAGRGLVQLFHAAGWQPLAAAGQRDRIDADDEAYRRAGVVHERLESAGKVAAAKEAPSAERKSAVPATGVYYLAHRNGEETWVVLTDRDSLSRFGSQLAAQDRLAVSETSSPPFRAIPRLQSQMRDALAKAAPQEKLQAKGLPAFGLAPDADADTGGGAKVAARSTKAAETGKAVEKDLKDAPAEKVAKEARYGLGDADNAVAAGAQWKGKTGAGAPAKTEAEAPKRGETAQLGQPAESQGQVTSGGLAVTVRQPAPAQEPARPTTAAAAPAAAPAPPAVQPSAEKAAPTAKAIAPAGGVAGGGAGMAVQTGASDRGKQQYTGEALDEQERAAQQNMAQAPPARPGPQEPGQETIQTEGGQTRAYFFADGVQRFHLALPRPEDQVILVIRLQAARAAAGAKDAAQK